MKMITMKYGEYKDNFFSCKTVKDSYNAETKTIEVMIPDGLADLMEIIPASEMESYRAELIESGCSEYANTYKMLELYAQDLNQMEYDPEQDEEWVEEAIKAAKRFYC